MERAINPFLVVELLSDCLLSSIKSILKCLMRFNSIANFSAKVWCSIHLVIVCKLGKCWKPAVQDLRRMKLVVNNRAHSFLFWYRLKIIDLSQVDFKNRVFVKSSRGTSSKQCDFNNYWCCWKTNPKRLLLSKLFSFSLWSSVHSCTEFNMLCFSRLKSKTISHYLLSYERFCSLIKVRWNDKPFWISKSKF